MIRNIQEQQKAAKIQYSFRNYAVAGLLLAVLYAALHDGFQPESAASACFVWGDALTEAAVLLMCAEGASYLSRHGMLDWLFYVLYQSRFLLMHKEDKEYTNFYDFKTLRKRSTVPYWPGLIVALMYFIAGFVMSMLYYTLAMQA